MSNEVFNPDFIEVGDLIRKCRENAGMTQADLSGKQNRLSNIPSWKKDNHQQKALYYMDGRAVQ